MRLSLTLNSGALDVWKGQSVVKKNNENIKLEAVQKFYYPRDMLSAERGYKLAVTTHLQMFMDNTCILPNGYQNPSATMCWFCGFDRRLGYSKCVRSVMTLWGMMDM